MPDIHYNDIKPLSNSYAAQAGAGKVRRNDAASQWGSQRKLVEDYAHDVRFGVESSDERQWMRFNRDGIVSIDKKCLHLFVDIDCSLRRYRLHHSHPS
jgi:hypothetical protein